MGTKATAFSHAQATTKPLLLSSCINTCMQWQNLQ